MALFASTLTGTTCDEHLSRSACVDAIVRFEVALACAQASLGLIPADAARAIETAGRDFHSDLDAIAVEGKRAGTPVVEILRQLRACVERRSRGAAEFLHFGATSQDALDTAAALCLKPCVELADAALQRSRAAAFRLARQHAASPMLARTLMQAAGITTFGLKTAQWGSALARCARRLHEARDEGLAVQLSGPIGSGLAYGERWQELRAALARDLGLGIGPAASWHTTRDAASNLLLQLALATGIAAKIAGDLGLMSQTEVAEIDEPSRDAGVSSAMPHKRNPVLCMQVRACSHVVQGLTGSLLSTIVVEHERGLGSWQAELAVAPSLVSYSVGALESLALLLEGVRFDAGRAQYNIDRAVESIVERGLPPPPTFDATTAVRAAEQSAKRILAEGGTES